MVGLCCFLPSKSTPDRFPATAAVPCPTPHRSKSEVPGNRYFVQSPVVTLSRSSRVMGVARLWQSLYPLAGIQRIPYVRIPYVRCTSEYPFSTSELWSKTGMPRAATLLVGHVFFHSAGGSPAAGHFSCAARKSNQEKAAPGVAPLIRGAPVLPALMWRLRNSTWRGAYNAPHCGTDSVPGGRKLGRNPTHGRLYRHWWTEARRLFPQTELRLTSPRRTVLVDFPPSSRAARRATRGKGKCTRAILALAPRSSSQHPALSTQHPAPSTQHPALFLPSRPSRRHAFTQHSALSTQHSAHNTQHAARSTASSVTALSVESPTHSSPIKVH